MLIVFAGLPGTGKTTLSRATAIHTNAVYLRIDTIGQAMRSGLLTEDVGAAGYAVALAMAEENLSFGRTVIADCVNPVRASRWGWQNLAAQKNVRLIEVEVICSDLVEHRRRVEGRTADLPGHVLPSWESVLSYAYEPWEGPHLVLDTALLATDAAVETIVAAVD